jgi:hypothetical protein
MRFPRKISTRLAIALFLVSVIGIAAAAVTLFSHTFPAVPAAVLQPTCSSTGPTGLTLNPAAVPPTSSGTIVANCSLAPAPAFVVRTTGFAIPSFGNPLPTGYTALAIFSDNTGLATTCSAASSGYVPLTSGAQVSFTSAVSAPGFDYCLTYANAPATGLGSFTVVWSQ